MYLSNNFSRRLLYAALLAALSLSSQAQNAMTPSQALDYRRLGDLHFSPDGSKLMYVMQSKGLYRALKHLGVETEMVLYPGEGHSPRNGSYNIDMFERILNWYDRFLKTLN